MVGDKKGGFRGVEKGWWKLLDREIVIKVGGGEGGSAGEEV